MLPRLESTEFKKEEDLMLEWSENHAGRNKETTCGSQTKNLEDTYLDPDMSELRTTSYRSRSMGGATPRHWGTSHSLMT